MESYFGEKRFTGAQISQTAIMAILSFLLIYGGLTIIEDENIFKKMYEGYTNTPQTWTATLPDGLTLTSLQKNIGSLRKKSDYNTTIGYILVLAGIIVIMYQLYSIFL
jgi:hypothetical protein